MNAADIIISTIKQEGPISFRDFMDIALYHPEYGYYTSPGDKLGQNGDFYTSPFVTSSFGHMIAKQIIEMWEQLNVPEFTIVEYGAGTGILCKDILTYLKTNIQSKKHLNYFIIEKSPSLRETQAAVVPAEVKWVDSIIEMKPFSG